MCEVLICRPKCDATFFRSVSLRFIDHMMTQNSSDHSVGMANFESKNFMLSDRVCQNGCFLCFHL